MACSFSPSSAARLQAVDAAAAAVKNARVLPLKASVSPAPRSLGGCKAARQEFEGATQDTSVSGTVHLQALKVSPPEFIYDSVSALGSFVR